MVTPDRLFTEKAAAIEVVTTAATADLEATAAVVTAAGAMAGSGRSLSS